VTSLTLCIAKVVATTSFEGFVAAIVVNMSNLDQNKMIVYEMIMLCESSGIRFRCVPRSFAHVDHHVGPGRSTGSRLGLASSLYVEVDV